MARGLRRQGHDLVIVQPCRNSSEAGHEYDGFLVGHISYRAPDLPYVRNYFKNERLYRRLTGVLRGIVQQQRIELIHAQHVLTAPPAIAAARAEHIPGVCTVRDYWPVCYWSDLVLNYSRDSLCPGCSPRMMTQCIRPRAGPAWPLALPMIPYMAANLARKRAALATADAIVAVSSTIARDLATRAPELRAVRLEVIPNPVDVAGMLAAASAGSPPELQEFALYVGKLAPNKGVGKLWPALDRARLPYPLVVIGDGSERLRLEQEAKQSRRPVIFTGWLPREDVLVWMRHARMLVFPSHGPESLSRVLLESAALGVPIAAMETGGTGDIIRHEETGLLSQSAEELGEHMGRLARDHALASKLGAAAREHIRATFETRCVIDRLERLYDELRRSTTKVPGSTRA